MHCDWNDWIKRRQGVKCLAKNTTWLTCKGPTQTHRGSLQSSKLQPFWLPWQEKNIFGNWNFNKSGQLVTDRFFKKKKEKKMQKIYKPLSNYQRLNANKLFCNSQIHVLTKCFLWQPFYNIDGCQSATLKNWAWSPAFLFNKLLMGMCCWKGLLLMRLDWL